MKAILTAEKIYEVLSNKGYHDIVINATKEVSKGIVKVIVSYKWRLNAWEKSINNQELVFYYDIDLNKWSCF